MILIKRLLKKMFGQQNASQIAKVVYYIPNCICNLFPMRNEILLESNPDFACNTYELYRYFLRIGLNKEFKLVWRVKNPEKQINNSPQNVFYIDKYPKGIVHKIKHYIRCNRSRVSISCNMNLPKYRVSKKQLNIYLDHGSQLKSMKTKDGQKAPLSCDYLISQSNFFIPYNLQEYTIREDQIICTGLPRDDQFYKVNDSLKLLIPYVKEYNKVIIWTPTFRAHKNGYQIDGRDDYPFGLPFIQSEDDIRKLLDCLEENRTILLIKPHPAQDISNLMNTEARSIRVVTSDQLSDAKIQINELLSQTDAMITDYSSIYYDYLFTNNPIALAIDDFKQYQDSRGFVFDNPLDILVGDLLYSFNDLIKFINNTSIGVDDYREKRRALQRKINDFDDGQASKRVYEFLISKLENNEM